MNKSTIMCLVAGMVFAAQAWPQQLATFGQVHLTAPPNSLLAGAYESDTSANLFLENLDFVLPANVTVDASQPGLYNSPAGVTPSILIAGTSVNDYYLHTDPVASTGTVFAGSIVFPTDILGVIESTASLAAADAVFGTSGVVYAGALKYRGFELNSTQDYFSISADGRTLTFQATTWQFVDDLRIVTAATAEQATGGAQAPEPAPICLGMLALGAGFAWRRVILSCPSKRY